MLFTKTFSFKIMLSRKNFTFKIMFFGKFFFFKVVLFKIARKTENMRILPGKLNKNVSFCAQFFFEIMLFKKIFFLKIWRFVFFQSKIGRVVKLWNQNLTRCEIFFLKIWNVRKFQLKIRKVLKLFLRNLIFILLFRFWRKWYLPSVLIPKLI